MPTKTKSVSTRTQKLIGKLPPADPSQSRLQAAHRGAVADLHRQIEQLTTERDQARVKIAKLEADLAQHDQFVTELRREAGGGWVYVA